MKRLLTMVLALCMVIGIASAEVTVAFTQIGQESDWRTANTDSVITLIGVELTLAEGTNLLVVAGKAGLTPGSMSQTLEVPATALSFHLKELVHSGLVSQERQGRNLIYRASFDTMDDLLGYLTENCCQGASCLAETAKSCDC